MLRQKTNSYSGRRDSRFVLMERLKGVNLMAPSTCSGFLQALLVFFLAEEQNKRLDYTDIFKITLTT